MQSGNYTSHVPEQDKWMNCQICTGGQPQQRGPCNLHWVCNNAYLGELEWPGTFNMGEGGGVPVADVGELW